MNAAELSPLERQIKNALAIGGFLWRAIKWRSIQLARFVWAYEREERKQ